MGKHRGSHHLLLPAAAAGARSAPGWPCPAASSGMLAAAVTAFMTIRPSGMMYIHCKTNKSDWRNMHTHTQTRRYWTTYAATKKLITKYKRKELTLVPLGISCCSVLSLSLILSLLLCYIVWLSHQKTKTADSVIIAKLALSISDLCVKAL